LHIYCNDSKQSFEVELFFFRDRLYQYNYGNGCKKLTSGTLASKSIAKYGDKLGTLNGFHESFFKQTKKFQATNMNFDDDFEFDGPNEYLASFNTTNSKVSFNGTSNRSIADESVRLSESHMKLTKMPIEKN
jgi:hypothetical protein